MEGAQETFEVQATQYLRPHGRRVAVTTTLSKGREIYQEMVANGHRFAVEELPTGQVAVYIESDTEDLGLKVVPNGPRVQSAMQSLLLEYRELLKDIPEVTP